MLNVLLILLLIYLGLKAFTRYLLPYLLKRFIRNTEKRYSTNYQKQQNSRQQEGETHINYIPEDYEQNDNTNGLGEYVDFEDVDDKI